MPPYPVSPLAPERFPELPPVAGVRLAAAATGMRYKGRTDLMLMELAPGSTIAGVFTRSLTAAPPVEWCRARVGRGRVRAIVVNAGNANAFTGRRGRAAVAITAGAVAKHIGSARDDVFVASTGVIGVQLPVESIVQALPVAKELLSPASWADAARAIMTTDTFPKGATRKAKIGESEVTINGFAKGSGMIAPDMATLIAVIATDARIPASALRAMTRESVERTFNCITVDGDTSTSDTLLVAATGRAQNRRVSGAGDRALAAFRAALEDVMRDLALQVVRDGEGAQKLVTIRVSGAASQQSARRIGLAIGNSPLVKTAIAAGDANWGRIVMAVGKAGEKADRDRLKIAIGGVEIAAKGEAVPGYDETPVARHMAGRDIDIAVDVGVGRGKAVVWSCDLTHGYIDINGSYRS